MEVVNRSPLVIIDGAHNESGSGVLAESLKEYFPGKRFICIMGVMKDKDYQAMLKNMGPLAKIVLTVTPPSNRGLPAELLAEVARNYCNVVIINDTIIGAVIKSLELSAGNDIICAFGSLYFIGEIRRYFMHY